MFSADRRDTSTPLSFPTLARLVLFTLAAILLNVSSALADDENGDEDWYEVRLFGYVEPIVLVEGNIRMQARLDTGAETTSLHATNIETFEKDDEEWVRFTTEGDDGKNAEYERDRTYRADCRGGKLPSGHHDGYLSG
ncbi:putative ATP-dependent zinc protease [Fodinicurvata halophila]|uniref:putative ATP-dependent zinc protease n=1 Tax=Fodinicurvata halophila TaxID=1419723 RepID=UPI00363C9953